MQVASAKVSFDIQTDRSRGYGFVVFEDEAAARNALKGMSGKPVGGRYIDVRTIVVTKNQKTKMKMKQ